MIAKCRQKPTKLVMIQRNCGWTNTNQRIRPKFWEIKMPYGSCRYGWHHGRNVSIRRITKSNHFPHPMVHGKPLYYPVHQELGVSSAALSAFLCFINVSMLLMLLLFLTIQKRRLPHWSHKSLVVMF